MFALEANYISFFLFSFPVYFNLDVGHPFTGLRRPISRALP